MLKFEKYDFPKLGYIKVPKLVLSKEDRIKFDLDENYSSDIFLRKLIDIKVEEKFKNNVFPEDKKDIYLERLNHEYNEIINLKFSDYILLVYRVLQFCAENDILTGPARGSGGGSLLLRVLDITKMIDPIKHDLLFERFISAARTDIKEIDGEMYISSASLPDIDNDSQASKKHLINDFLSREFNGQSCAIANIVTFQSKALLKEVLKCYEKFTEDESKEVSSMIEVKFGKNDSVEESLNNNTQFSQWAKEHQESVNIVLKLDGLVKNKSIHAAGILLCNDKLNDVVPLELSSSKEIICGYNMEYAQSFGIKMDNLGLKNLDIIDEVTKSLGIKMENIDVTHSSVYHFLNNTDCYYGIFQAEEGLGKNTLKKIKPKTIDDIILSISLGRPGSLKFIDDAVKHKTGEKLIEVHDILKPILKESYNVIAYQEQIMKISQVMGGFSAKSADRLRKGIGKKIKSIIQELRPLFIEGSIKNGHKKEDAEKIFDTFEAAGDYSFNKCLDPSTIVNTKNGLKTMNDCQIGDLILAYDIDNKCNIFTEITQVYNNEVELFEVTLEDGRKIKSSMNHKFLTKENGMKTLKDIILNNFEIVTNTNNEFK